MKKSMWFTISLCVLAGVEGLACDVCKKQQPKILRGITHGAGPQSDWDYLMVGAAALLVVISVFYTIKWILNPGEKETQHIKHSILN